MIRTRVYICMAQVHARSNNHQLHIWIQLYMRIKTIHMESNVQRKRQHSKVHAYIHQRMHITSIQVAQDAQRNMRNKLHHAKKVPFWRQQSYPRCSAWVSRETRSVLPPKCPHHGKQGLRSEYHRSVYMHSGIHTWTRSRFRRLHVVNGRLPVANGRLPGINGRVPGINGHLLGINGRLRQVNGLCVFVS